MIEQELRRYCLEQAIRSTYGPIDPKDLIEAAKKYEEYLKGETK